MSSVLELPKTKKIYVVGMAGLEEELQNEGYSVLGGSVCEDMFQPLPTSCPPPSLRIPRIAH